MALIDQQSQVSSFLRQYLDQSTLDASTNNVIKYRKVFEEILSPVESWIMAVQSLLVWEKPYRSAVLIAVINIIFWVVSSMTNHILAVISWGTLMVYLVYMWKTQIWPTIRVPSPLNDGEDWVPIEANLLSVPELSQYIAEFLVSCQLHGEALISVRHKRRTAFFVLMVAKCSMLFVIGHYISGFTLSYIIVMSILIWPCAVYHKVLPRVYMVLEPYLMTLQYKMMSRIKTKRAHERRGDGNGGVVETDSEDEMAPAINPELSAAIARSITDSEDEGGSPSATRETSIGYNSDIDCFGERPAVVDSHLDEPCDDFSLDPDVSQMPDFENVCEDSNTFMLDTTEMPGLDEIDRSRIMAHPTAPPHSDTDSETEDLPYDLPTRTSTLPAPANTDVILPDPAQSSHIFPSALPVDSWSAMASSFVAGMMQSEHDELRVDPRDRIADASVVEGDSDSDFEFVLKEDIIDETSYM